MVFIDVPTARRRWKISAGPVQAGLRILGFEATRAIQNVAHDVRLIAGKGTVLRVYVEPRGLSSNLRVRGEIVISPGPGAPRTYVISANEISLRSSQHPSLTEQRRDAALSLNFLLPSPPLGPLTVGLKRASPVSGGSDFPVLPDGNEFNVEFISAPILRTDFGHSLY
ncbi:hypothetical protein JOH52_006743 [Sinorhizobium meliloti]|nr:hypothetical protein [Sinorhizobium meliloti]MBP2470651.1 hypothetical protein [Sinorhizobium meliloti]MDE3786135.1 hypothetical protein [Sinorhizobium meliloti]MDE4550489.1 hypothetical protein [Sinorhizobium meliloti]MDE4598091.1 hypothetical protein [Sinorhizobium meliloti]MQW78858.1 hypothetical protein [Sinorhizobium meliloti]